MYRKQSRRVGERADVTGWGCETRSGRESGRLKCRSAETPWALVSAGLAVFEKRAWPLASAPACGPLPPIYFEARTLASGRLVGRPCSARRWTLDSGHPAASSQHPPSTAPASVTRPSAEACASAHQRAPEGTTVAGRGPRAAAAAAAGMSRRAHPVAVDRSPVERPGPLSCAPQHACPVSSLFGVQPVQAVLPCVASSTASCIQASSRWRRTTMRPLLAVVRSAPLATCTCSACSPRHAQWDSCAECSTRSTRSVACCDLASSKLN